MKRSKELNKNLIFDEIVSIEYVGEEETFDLEMEYEPHNFFANGVVSHNSHSVSYTLMTYWGQYAKVHHPLEFWTTSLQFASEDDIPKRLDELRKIKQSVKIKPPSVNYSDEAFACDPETHSIYWSISKIKGLGTNCTPAIVQERKNNGLYRSIEDFRNRVEKRTINKAKIFALIMAGAFDEIEHIRYVTERLKLVKEFFLFYKVPLPEIYKDEQVYNEYFWIKEQKRLTGYGYIDYSVLLSDDDRQCRKLKKLFVTGETFAELKDYTECCVVGEVIDVKEKTSKKGRYVRLTLMSNYTLVPINIWSEKYEEYSELFLNNIVGKIFAVSGTTRFSTYQNIMQLNVNDSTIIKML